MTQLNPSSAAESSTVENVGRGLLFSVGAIVVAIVGYIILAGIIGIYGYITGIVAIAIPLVGAWLYTKGAGAPPKAGRMPWIGIMIAAVIVGALTVLVASGWYAFSRVGKGGITLTRVLDDGGALGRRDGRDPAGDHHARGRRLRHLRRASQEAHPGRRTGSGRLAVRHGGAARHPRRLPSPGVVLNGEPVDRTRRSRSRRSPAACPVDSDSHVADRRSRTGLEGGTSTANDARHHPSATASRPCIAAIVGRGYQHGQLRSARKVRATTLSGTHSSTSSSCGTIDSNIIAAATFGIGGGVLLLTKGDGPAWLATLRIVAVTYMTEVAGLGSSLAAAGHPLPQGSDPRMGQRGVPRRDAEHRCARHPASPLVAFASTSRRSGSSSSARSRRCAYTVTRTQSRSTRASVTTH